MAETIVASIFTVALVISNYGSGSGMSNTTTYSPTQTNSSAPFTLEEVNVGDCIHVDTPGSRWNFCLSVLRHLRDQLCHPSGHHATDDIAKCPKDSNEDPITIEGTTIVLCLSKA